MRMFIFVLVYVIYNSIEPVGMDDGGSTLVLDCMVDEVQT